MDFTGPITCGSLEGGKRLRGLYHSEPPLLRPALLERTAFPDRHADEPDRPVIESMQGAAEADAAREVVEGRISHRFV